MRNIRCNNFDDNGKILNMRHLKDLKCTYIHPDNPAWAHARISQPRRTVSDAWAPDGPSSAGSTTLTSSNKASLAATRSWGTIKEDRSAKKHDAQPGSSWDSSKNTNTSESSRAENNPLSSSSFTWAEKESGASWTDTLAKAAEKGDLSNGWGSSSGNDGWGSGGGSWGGANDSGKSLGQAGTTGGWDIPSSSAKPDRPSASGPWGEVNKGIGVGRGEDKEDVSMRDPSPPPRPRPSTATATIPPPSLSDDYARKPKRAELDPDVRPAARDRTPCFSPAPSAASELRPLPRPIMTSLSRTTFAESARNASLGDEDGMGKMSQSGTPTSVSVPKSYKGYQGRVALFSEVVSNMQEAVVFEIVLRHAQTEATRWKKTQSSEIYAHPTQKARSILDALRAQYNDKMSRAKSARDQALNHLATLPELPTIAEQLAGPKVEKQKIQAYTNELKEWFQDLEKHRSLLKAQQEVEEAKLKPSHPAPLSGIPPTPELQSLQSLLQRERWSWKELKVALPLIELAIGDTQELVYGESYTRLDELCDELMVLDEQLPPHAIEVNDDETSSEETQLRMERIGANEQKIEAQANSLAELVNRIHKLQKDIETVKEEREKMDEICARGEKQFSEFDNAKETDSAKIQELTEQLQNLGLHKRPAAISSTTLLPMKMDDLLEYIRPFVVQRVQDDLTRVVQNLSMRCRENQDRLEGEIDEMLKPVLTKTEQIRQDSLSLSVMSTSQYTNIS